MSGADSTVNDFSIKRINHYATPAISYIPWLWSPGLHLSRDRGPSCQATNPHSLPRANNPLQPPSDVPDEILLAIRIDGMSLARVPRPGLTLEQVVPRDRVGGLHAQVRGRDVVDVRLVQGREDRVVWRQADVVPVRVPLVRAVVARGQTGRGWVGGVLDGYDVVADVSA